MIFAKFENEKLIICPRNGYVGDVAISNLPTFFENNPEIAKEEGWRKFIPLEEPADSVGYEIVNGIIYEKSI